MIIGLQGRRPGDDQQEGGKPKHDHHGEQDFTQLRQDDQVPG